MFDFRGVLGFREDLDAEDSASEEENTLAMESDEELESELKCLDGAGAGVAAAFLLLVQFSIHFSTMIARLRLAISCPASNELLFLLRWSWRPCDSSMEW